jgi:signal transduction histidine kinase
MRLLVLVVSVQLLMLALMFIPGLQRERWAWLHGRLNAAELVVLAVGTANNGMPPSDGRRALERLSGAEMILILDPHGVRNVLPPIGTPMPAQVVMLDSESWVEGLARALAGLAPPGVRRLELVGTSRLGTRLDLLVPEAKLARFLRDYALRFAALALVIVASTGALLVLALRALLVAPLGRIAGSIALFRDNPEGGVPLDAERVSVLRDDEITLVGRELAGMQAELRTALWRNARLAAVGTAVAKMSHDLRGILSAALLVADRLTMSREASVQQAGEVIVRAVHRATALAQQTLEFVREGPPALNRVRTRLRGLVDEAGAVVCGEGRCDVRNHIAAEAEATIDRESILRVLTNLFRNAVQAGARVLTVTSTGEDAGLAITVADDGPGLPEGVRERLFQPFVSFRSGGTGLGLAIARDLMRAHGGDLQLAATGPEGTSFVLHVQQPRADEE